MRLTRFAALCLLAMAVTVAAAQAGAVRYFIDSEPAGVGTDVVLDFNPSALTSRNETPDSIAFFLPAGWRFDHRAVARECTPTEAAASQCPLQAQIGYGHTVVRVTGYLFPGGDTSGVAYITPFLGRPLQPGDKASMVLEVQVLGLDPVIAGVKQYTGITIRTTYSIVGRVIPLHSGPYGLEAAFNGFPGGLTVPPPAAAAGVTVTNTRFKLLVGGVRRVTKKIVDKIKAPTLNGGTQTLRIPDREQIGYHLLSRGMKCPASRQWPYQLQVGFPDVGTQTYAGTMGCNHNAKPPPQLAV